MWRTISSPPGRYVAISAGAVLLLLVFLPDVFSEDPDKKKKAGAEDGERREGA